MSTLRLTQYTNFGCPTCKVLVRPSGAGLTTEGDYYLFGVCDICKGTVALSFETIMDSLDALVKTGDLPN